MNQLILKHAWKVKPIQNGLLMQTAEFSFLSENEATFLDV